MLPNGGWFAGPNQGRGKTMGNPKGRRSGRRHQENLEKGQRIARQMTGASDVRIISAERQEDKLSNALCVLLRNEVPNDADKETYEITMGFIATAWNATFVPEEKRTDFINSVIPHLGTVADEERLQIHGYIDELIRRKQALFPDDRRVVVSWAVNMGQNGLSVTATGVYSAN